MGQMDGQTNREMGKPRVRPLNMARLKTTHTIFCRCHRY